MLFNFHHANPHHTVCVNGSNAVESPVLTGIANFGRFASVQSPYFGLDIRFTLKDAAAAGQFRPPYCDSFL